MRDYRTARTSKVSETSAIPEMAQRSQTTRSQTKNTLHASGIVTSDLLRRVVRACRSGIYGRGDLAAVGLWLTAVSPCCKSDIRWEKKSQHLVFYCSKCDFFIDWLPKYYR